MSMTPAKARRVRSLLIVGDCIYIRPGKDVVPSKILSMDECGIDTEHDFYEWEEHGFLWWLTKKVAMENMNKEANA